MLPALCNKSAIGYNQAAWYIYLNTETINTKSIFSSAIMRLLLHLLKGSVIECMMSVKIKKKAAEQNSFVRCEARQSRVLSILPVSKGSAKWDKKDRDAELQMQGVW